MTSHVHLSLHVNEQSGSVIGWFGRATATAQQEDADRKHAVADGAGIRPGARKQEEEELQVRHQEDGGPRPHRKWRQVGGNGGGQHQRAVALHALQTDHLKHQVGGHDAEQQEESHAHPAHPLAEVHHPPYCRGRNV